VGSNPHTPHTFFAHLFCILYSVWGGTPHFGSGMKTASAALFWHLPVPGDCAPAHASGVVAALAQTFRPRRACDRRMDPQRSHAPAVCEPPHSGACPLYLFPAKWSAKCYAPPNSGSAGAVVDRLCLRLSSASGRAHWKNGDLRTFYALAAISYRHAT